MTNILLAAAEDYVAAGLRVIALTGKMPNGAVHPHGLLDAMDATTFRVGAFLHEKTTGVGILTGAPYYVVDIDGEEGAAQWLAMVGEDGIPDRWVAKTGRGLHLWFADWVERPTVKLGPKLDFKGLGGYVAAPPSIHPAGHRYEWLAAPEGAVLELPDGLRRVLDRKARENEARMTSRVIMRVVRKHSFEDGRFYAVATFDGIIKRMRVAAEGERNNVLNWAAYAMVGEGADEEDLDELIEAATAVGLPRRETRRTIRSALAARSDE